MPLPELSGHDHRLGQNRCSLDGAELAKRNPGSSGRKDDHGQLSGFKQLLSLIHGARRYLAVFVARTRPLVPVHSASTLRPFR